MIFAERFKYLINLNGLSQTALAKDLGITDAAVSNYLSNSRQPDLTSLCNIADYFDVSCDYLLGRSDKPKDYIEDENIDTILELYKKSDSLTRGAVKAQLEYFYNMKRNNKK